jgi:hypothetical protein
MVMFAVAKRRPIRAAAYCITTRQPNGHRSTGGREDQNRASGALGGVRSRHTRASPTTTAGLEATLSWNDSPGPKPLGIAHARRSSRSYQPREATLSRRPRTSVGASEPTRVKPRQVGPESTFHPVGGRCTRSSRAGPRTRPCATMRSRSGAAVICKPGDAHPASRQRQRPARPFDFLRAHIMLPRPCEPIDTISYRSVACSG